MAATISDYHEPEGLRRFAAAVDVISFEFENVSAEGLDLLASLKPVRPSPETLRHQSGPRPGEDLPQPYRHHDGPLDAGR